MTKHKILTVDVSKITNVDKLLEAYNQPGCITQQKGVTTVTIDDDEEEKLMSFIEKNRLNNGNMKANELMIGDWVYFCHNDEWDTKVVGKVSLLSCGNSEFNEFPHVEKKTVGRIQVEAEDDFQFWQTDEGRNFEPIPLTPEILEKNGYTCKRSLDKEIRSYNWTSPDRRVTLNDQNGSPWFCIIRSEGMMEEVMIGITYVHELQHALKLCKIKKEIIL